MPHTIELAGETVTLCPERAIYWPAQATLFIADAHFGKAHTFRSRGVFVPHGTTEDNLARLDALIARWTPERITFLGDFLHAREAQQAGCPAAADCLAPEKSGSWLCSWCSAITIDTPVHRLLNSILNCSMNRPKSDPSRCVTIPARWLIATCWQAISIQAM